MHSLSASFVLGYHGCDRETGERLLLNEPFRHSQNSYDWLGWGVYFWEVNPGRALEWATERNLASPYVVGAVIDPGYCLDLVSDSGIRAVQKAYSNFQSVIAASHGEIPRNTGGRHQLDCAVTNYLHATREESGEPPFDTVRGVS